ncbi:UNVERIFIED_CONTAM: hypothetical protein GTU68_048034, partial [Idotea baltica]|nr:hypothetical protein [Idotea baltica]
MNGSAGWPLNCITLANGKPFFAGTYFPKTQWANLLGKVNEIWTQDKSKIEEQANSIANGISENSMFQPVDGQPIDSSFLVPAAKQWLSMYDKKQGGYDRAPKFPMPANLEALLTLYKLTDSQEALDVARLTLTKMGHGGIYDQVGGGFARYSTDGYWKVPHFEKMLYDNGQLLSAYAKAYQVTKDPSYKQIVHETILFMQRELLAEDGGFYASLDADSEGEEGLFYVWKKSELEEALGEHANVIMDYYQITQNGNWEHEKNILLPVENTDQILKKYDLKDEELQKIVMDSKGVLLAKRAEKVRPELDDKILTAWNGLAIIGLTNAYRTFQDDSYLKLATTAANFLSEKMMQNDFRLDRNYKNGKTSINGFLDDYAFTIDAFIQMYQVTFDERWLDKAKSLTDYVIVHFSDQESSYFFYT